jgi:hypothetical protein
LHDWYDNSPDQSSKYQGDILSNVAMVLPPPADRSAYILRPSSPVTVADALGGVVPKVFLPRAEGSVSDAWKEGYEFVLVRARKGPVQIVTQSCDIDRRSAIQVAPVFELASYTGGESKRQSIKNGEVGYLQYLPAHDAFPESYSDLSQITWLPKAAVARAALLKRLTPEYLAHFQRKLSILVGRAFSFTASDDIPQAATYLCYTCFVRHGRIEAIDLSMGGRFPTCDHCQQALWVKKVPPSS